MNEILVALISGGITLLGVLISNSKSQAVMDTKIEELTREVRKHNNFAERIPVMQEQIKVANHRIEDLQRKADDEYEGQEALPEKARPVLPRGYVGRGRGRFGHLLAHRQRPDRRRDRCHRLFRRGAGALVPDKNLCG